MLKSLLAEVPYETISVPVKTILLEAGKIAQKVFFVRSGCIRQWYNANGKDITCQFFFENSPIACIESFIKSQPSEYTLETVLPSEIYVIRGEDIQKWVQNNPEQMAEITKIAFERMIYYSKLFLSRIKETPQQRYEALVKKSFPPSYST